MTSPREHEDPELRQVAIDEIQVPKIRSTAQYDDDLAAELTESIARQGILQPVQLEEVDGKLWLVDGYHRIQAARALGMSAVPALVKPGNAEGVMLRNLITARQKGRPNPGDEARLIRHLREEGGRPLEEIAALTGMSVSWARRLHDISYLPSAVLRSVTEGRMGVSHALELCRLSDSLLQQELADQVVQWTYTVEQTRLRVDYLLRPSAIPQPGATVFSETGAPSRVPIPCYVCHVDLTGNVSYLYMCGECQALINEFLQEYGREAGRAPSSPSPSAAPDADSPPPGAGGGA